MLFSQVKHSGGGKLNARNYATARCANLVKTVVAPPIQLSDSVLVMKKYGNISLLYTSDSINHVGKLIITSMYIIYNCTVTTKGISNLLFGFKVIW